MTTAIQWRGSVEALADDLRALVPPGEWPKFIALFMPRAEPRPLPAYLARFPQGPASPPSEHPAAEQQPIVPRLSERARKVLEKLSLAEPRDFAGLKWIDLLRVDGCGTKTRAELLAWAGEHGAHLIHRLPKREREALVSKEPAR